MATGNTSINMTDKSKIKKEYLDWEDLRQQSLKPGGFGESRVNIWPKVLNVSKEHIPPKEDAEKADKSETQAEIEEAHQDERQIGLDTDRSFVLYPVDSEYDRETLQAGLNKLLIQLFRQRPKLSYFQGYHDIATVIFLTLPPELHLACIEKLSLHRLRDSMGAGLEPILGLLRITKNLLRLADPDYAALLEENAQLPFYALSNLLTLFSHDMPTLPLIQHVFDYLLCRPPIAAVYLATVFILVRKQEAIRLAEEDEEGMIHSLLSSLPKLQDDPSCVDEDLGDKQGGRIPIAQPSEEETAFLKEGPEEEDKSILSGLALHSNPVAVESAHPTDPLGNDSNTTEDDDLIPRPDSNSAKLEDGTPGDEVANLDDGNFTQLELSPSEDKDEVKAEPQDEVGNLDDEKSTLLELSPSEDTKVEVKAEPQDDIVLSYDQGRKPKHASILFLTDVLKQADELYQRFPPDYPEVGLSATMGPQSVVFTWCESSVSLPSDNTAEAMVLHPELVVYPYVPEPDHDQEISKEAAVQRGNEERKRRNKLRKSPFGQMERKTMLAGTVLVLGVAMAVYGIKARNATGHPLFVDGNAHPTTKDLKRLSGWISGVLIGVSGKLLGGVGSDS